MILVFKKFKKFLKWISAFICALFVFPENIYANTLPDEIPSDMTWKVGAAVGTLTRTRSVSRKVESYTVGGVPFTLAFLNDSSREWTTLWQIQLVMDFANDQILRKGLDVGFDYHVFGGGFATRQTYPVATGFGSSKSGFSLLGRLGWHSYTAIAKQEGSIELTGSAMETKAGLGYRSRISEKSDFGVELIRTLTSLPWDKEQVGGKLTELSFVLRLII